MKNSCKKKGCINEALDGRKYCNHHQSRIEDRKRVIVNGAGALATFAIAAILKRKPK